MKLTFVKTVLAKFDLSCYYNINCLSWIREYCLTGLKI